MSPKKEDNCNFLTNRKRGVPNQKEITKESVISPANQKKTTLASISFLDNLKKVNKGNEKLPESFRKVVCHLIKTNRGQCHRAV